MTFLAAEAMKTAEPLPGWRGRFWHSANMSFAHYRVDAGSAIHAHYHPYEEVWLVIEGELEVTVGDETRTAGPGGVAVIPPDVTHSVRALTAGVAVVTNYPVRHDFA